MKKTLSLILILSLVLSLVPGASMAAPSAYGSEVQSWAAALHDNASLHDGTFWSEEYDRPRHEYYFTYTPGGPVTPAVTYGESVCGRETVGDAAAAYEAQGYRVVGGINGDFYDTSSGCPLGIVISGGELLSGSDDALIQTDEYDKYYAVGFRADGTAVMGAPSLQITAQSGGQIIPMAGINKMLWNAQGAVMLTSDYRTDHTMGSEGAGASVLASLVAGTPAIGSTVTLQVSQVVEGAYAEPLQEGQVVLTAVDDYAHEQVLASLRAMVPGQEVTVSFSTPDPAWSEVTEAIGALHLLVENGAARKDLEEKPTAAPRTAVGLRPDGSLVLHTVDGRQNSHSMGAGLDVLAQRMAELGCVTAICLDGGGSTTAVSSRQGGSPASLVNSPSDGKQRRVTNHLLLLAPGYATGVPHRLTLSADTLAVLPGHEVHLTSKLIDSNYFPMSGEVQYSATAGEIVGDTLIAPQERGIVIITARYGDLTAELEIEVVDEPEELTILRDGKKIESLSLAGGESARLTVTAEHQGKKLNLNYSDVIWTVDPSLGSFDEEGLFHAAAFGNGSGTLTVSRGDVSTSIPITVTTDCPFVDLEGHWARPYMLSLYQQGVLNGVTIDGQLYALPDQGVTRAQFAALLSRYLKINAADYADTQAPFADMDSVPDWAANEAKAMYALGIINGAEVNGQTVFDPDGILTRAQGVTMIGRLLALQNEQGEPELPAIPDGGSLFIGLVQNPYGTPGEGSPAAPEEPGPSQEELQALALEALMELFPDAQDAPAYSLPHFQTLVEMGAFPAENGLLAPNAPMTRAVICRVLATLH